MECEYEDEIEYESKCTMCRTKEIPIAILGKVIHYNCRNCGLWWQDIIQEEANV